MNINAILGDITNYKVNIIVNAANKTLLGGGGVDGMIHRKAGKKLLEECKGLGGCETGEAKMTDAYNLPCDKVIHTVGPVYYGGNKNEDVLLYNAYKNSMMLTEQYRVDNNLDRISIAFPSISTGVYRYPKDEASNIAIKAVRETNFNNIDVYFVCYSLDDYKIYIKNLYNIIIK